MSLEIRPVPNLIFVNPLEDSSSAEEESGSEGEDVARTEISPQPTLVSEVFNPYGKFMYRIMETRNILLSGFEPSEKHETFDNWIEGIRNVFIDTFEKI